MTSCQNAVLKISLFQSCFRHLGWLLSCDTIIIASSLICTKRAKGRPNSRVVEVPSHFKFVPIGFVPGGFVPLEVSSHWTFHPVWCIQLFDSTKTLALEFAYIPFSELDSLLMLNVNLGSKTVKTYMYKSDLKKMLVCCILTVPPFCPLSNNFCVHFWEKKCFCVYMTFIYNSFA